MSGKHKKIAGGEMNFPVQWKQKCYNKFVGQQNVGLCKQHAKTQRKKKQHLKKRKNQQEQ